MEVAFFWADVGDLIKGSFVAAPGLRERDLVGESEGVEGEEDRLRNLEFSGDVASLTTVDSLSAPALSSLRRSIVVGLSFGSLARRSV